MALDPRFICSGDIESYFVDKLTGLPLAAGVIKFYSDTSPSVPKSVYKLSGTGPGGTYSFVALGDTLTLNSVGEYQDGGGNPIVIYYFPYHCTTDGDPTTSTGVQELYYITVENSGAQQQYTRSQWPPLSVNLAPSPSSSSNLKNFIPNGQFLAYNAHPVTTTVTNSLHTNDAIQLAQGGWSFQQTQGSSGVYVISVAAVPNGSAGAINFPINAVEVKCNSAGSETIHDLVIQWPNVNTFSLQGVTNSFTLSFIAKSNTLSTYAFQVVLTSYFGVGSATMTTETVVSTVNIAPGYAQYNVIVPFPDNSAAVPTTGNTIQLSLRTPSGSTCDALFTDFSLVPGTIAPASFPTQTNAEMLDEGIAGWMPTPAADGSSLYLPLTLTPEGMQFDQSQIGNIMAKTYVGDFTGSISNSTNELLCDGSTYLTNGYSVLGIPYSRLQAKVFRSADNMPIFGTGSAFVSAYVSAGTNTLVIFNTNTAGAVTAPATGITSPFASNPFSVMRVGTAGYQYNAWTNSGSYMTSVGTFAAAATANPNSATFTMTQLSHVAENSGYYKAFSTVLQSASAIANPGMAGAYIQFSNSTTQYFVWFQISTETAPAPGGTAIKTIVDASFTAADVAKVAAAAVSGQQSYKIDFSVANIPPTANSYWTFSTNSTDYYVWYRLNGSGTDPAPANKTGIMVDVVTADTTATMASKTVAAINGFQFAVPDLRGVFLRGIDTTGIWDIDHSNRWNVNNINSPNNIGSMELDQFIYNQIDVSPTGLSGDILSLTGTAATLASPGGGAAINAAGTIALSNSGGSETRPVNMYVWYAIKY